MAISNQRQKYHLAMAGEYLVAAQLQRIHLTSSVTYGNAKSADIVAFDPQSEKALVVEVKTSSKGRWPVGSRVPPPSSKIWVFVSLSEDVDTPPEFFVLTQSQLHHALAEEERAYFERFKIKHGYEFGDRAGVARLLYKQALPFRNSWHTIINAFST